MAGRLRMFFAPRFLKRGWLTAGVWVWSMAVSMVGRPVGWWLPGESEMASESWRAAKVALYFSLAELLFVSDNCF